MLRWLPGTAAVSGHARTEGQLIAPSSPLFASVIAASFPYFKMTFFFLAITSTYVSVLEQSKPRRQSVAGRWPEAGVTVSRVCSFSLGRRESWGGGWWRRLLSNVTELAAALNTSKWLTRGPLSCLTVSTPHAHFRGGPGFHPWSGNQYPTSGSLRPRKTKHF